MKTLSLSLWLLTGISIGRLYATGQQAELIISKGDTLQLLSLPLEDYLGAFQEREEKYPFLKLTCSTLFLFSTLGHPNR